MGKTFQPCLYKFCCIKKPHKKNSDWHKIQPDADFLITQNHGDIPIEEDDQDQKKKVEAKAKELPAEISIPEARTDKVRLFQEQDERVRVEQQLLIEKFKASQEWRALEDRQKSITELMAAELSAALRNAGVEEKDYAQYTYDKATLKFKKKVEEPKK